MKYSGKCCFFAHEKIEQLKQEQYSTTDIRILKELGFDVVIATNINEVPYGCSIYFSWWASGSIIPLIKALASRKPIIIVAGGQEAMLTIDSLTGKPYGYLATPWYKKLATRLCLYFGTRILVVSKYMVNDIQKLGAKNPLVVHNCIDTDLFKIENIERTFVTIIFNSHEQAASIKRAEIFIKSIPIVVKKFPNQRFIVIGEQGSAHKKMQKLVADLEIKDHLSFIGPIDNSEVPNFLNRSIAYVQISESETFGVAVAEAMSCGTPVVVSEKGALPEIVGKHGIYVDNNNPQSVADGILSILKTPASQNNETGLKLRQRIVENFSYFQRKELIKNIIANL